MTGEGAVLAEQQGRVVDVANPEPLPDLRKQEEDWSPWEKWDQDKLAPLAHDPPVSVSPMLDAHPQACPSRPPPPPSLPREDRRTGPPPPLGAAQG